MYVLSAVPVGTVFLVVTLTDYILVKVFEKKHMLQLKGETYFRGKKGRY